MLRIAFSTLAARKSGTLGALAAVGLAVSLVVSYGILLESSVRAPIRVERLQAAAVVVQADPKIHPPRGEADVPVLLEERRQLDESVAGRISRLPGVARVIADRSIYAQVVDRQGQLVLGGDGGPSVGHGWESAQLTPYTLTAGHAPRRPAEVVLDAREAAEGSFRPGDRVRIVTASSPERFTVVGIASAPAHPETSRQGAVFFRHDVAARLSGERGGVDLFGILTAPGADPEAVAERVRAGLHLPGVQVLTGAKRGGAESPGDVLSREDAVAGLTVFAVLAAFVAVFVVAATFALSVQQRHRELALFRAIGTTPRQVRRMVAAEALLVALLAWAVAAPIGLLIAHLERGLFIRAGLVPEGLHLVVGWIPFAGGVVAAVVTTQVAAFASARRASRIRPTDALREATGQRRSVSWVRAVAGLGVLGAGVATLLVLAGRSASGADSDAPAATAILMLAAVLLGPLLALPFAWLLGWPLAAVSRGPGMLARANTRANLRRAASVATPAMLAVAVVCTILFAKSAIRHETADQTAQRTTAGYVLRAHDAPGLPPAAAAAARRVPGVRDASGSIATSLVATADGVTLRLLPARGVDPGTLAGVIDLDVESGSLAGLRGETLAVSTSAARSLGWHLGDRVNIWLGDGTRARLRVVATFTRPLGFGEIVLPRTLAEHHVTQPLDDAVFVTAAPGSDGAGLLDRLHALARAYPAIDVLTRASYEHELSAAADKESLAVDVLLAVVGGFCALALVNAMAMATAERAREFALLRLVGASKRQVRAMVRAETLIMVTYGLTIGSLIAAAGLAGVRAGLGGSMLSAVPFKLYAALIAVYAVLGFAAGDLPARIAMRMNPIKAMAARE